MTDRLRRWSGITNDTTPPTFPLHWVTASLTRAGKETWKEIEYLTNDDNHWDYLQAWWDHVDWSATDYPPRPWTLPYRPPSIISSRPWLPPLLDRVSHEYDLAARASWYDEIVIASLIISYQDGGGSSSSRWWWTFKLDQDSPMGK